MERKLIWMPYGLHTPGYEFSILLDPGFAKDMFYSKLSREKRAKFQKLASEELNQLKYNQIEPFLFHGNTCFVRQINIDGGNGKWLAVDGLYGRKPDFNEPVSYSSHNLNCSSDSHALLSLVDVWVEYAQLLKES